MPKIIDHEKRREQIAEATWRVIVEQGMEGATVRGIAKEAGLSLGALRHYFATQDELLMYAMQLVKERATARIAEVAADEELLPKERFTKIFLELLPTNQEKMVEMEVWFAFTVYFRHKKDGFDAQHDGIYAGVRKLLDSADQLHLLRKELDKELEAEKLYAVIDGLALHAYLEPQRVDGERITKVLEHHLASLFH
ncbi:TetR family transcriptional regulator C-terminal domain-containing protein [Brevibacillus formosus]|uniref:TetR/AcrR family transcriptional regulator n=1 Tax=Brevibacillus TaxID=55080 RepID=UPI000D108B6A|nr:MULTISPECIES: TetR family transcriptional regulator C-terminal domain-containing protein [Brevibacillus]MBG9942569.1 TetR family transcriptional regulator [Brevibacillus formosus]MED1945803.1 TetR family transcriptional regulator C-terminal domain-containing protein [Brevibacillus formosus]MED2001242.1 TetR family transcriptional regulator C-terminal domain-containing protein [Brevibacillus formosus]MED2085200.1 TetR family transcriptional regulator C-terminal domain-containing protein [Brev